MKTSIGTAKQTLVKIVKSCHEHKLHMPVYLHSSPGVGKSAIVLQVCDDLDLGFVDVRLAQMEQSDVQGIPFVRDDKHGNQIMSVSDPEWFPTKTRVKNGEFPEKGILFFDELSNAPVPVQHAAYRIILDREVHRGAELAEGWVIVAAGNLKADKTGAKGVAPALANRFAVHLEIDANLDDFTSYALSAGFNEEIIGFLNFDSSKLYSFDPKKNDVAFATPRSWEQISNHLKIPYNNEELSLVLGGCVGDAVATEFLSFRKYYKDLPDFQKIMAGELKYKVPDDRGIVFALVSSLIVNLAQNGKDEKKVKNLEKIMTQLDDDFLILTYKTLKNGAEDDVISNILMNTLDTFKRVSRYIKAGDID